MNLTLDPATGFYALPLVAGAPVLHVSPSGSDANLGTTPDQPLQTYTAARKKLKKGQPGAVLFLAGSTFLDQPPWVEGGGHPDAPWVLATYGGPGRTLFDNSTPTPNDTACQVRGHTFLSDLDFYCQPGKPGVSMRDGNYEVFAQNVRVRNAGLGWDVQGPHLHWHRCLTLDCWAASGRSQGAYVSVGGRATATGKVFDMCGWKPGVPVSTSESGKNHCLYYDEEAEKDTADLQDVWASRPCSHAFQMRAGGRLRNFVVYGAPIGGFIHGPRGDAWDGYLECDGYNQLGQGQTPGGEYRGWGFELTPGDGTLGRVGMRRGGNSHPIYGGSSNSLKLGAMVGDALMRAPGYVPHGVRVNVEGVRIADWLGGVSVKAPAEEVGKLEVEEDAPGRRWDGFTARHYLEQVRSLDRTGDWSIISRVARMGYDSLEQVTNKGSVKRVNEAVAATLVEQAAVLRKAVE